MLHGVSKYLLLRYLPSDRASDGVWGGGGSPLRNPSSLPI